MIITGPHGGAAIGIHEIHQMRQPRMTPIETINREPIPTSITVMIREPTGRRLGQRLRVFAESAAVRLSSTSRSAARSSIQRANKNTAARVRDTEHAEQSPTAQYQHQNRGHGAGCQGNHAPSRPSLAQQQCDQDATARSNHDKRTVVRHGRQQPGGHRFQDRGPHQRTDYPKMSPRSSAGHQVPRQQDRDGRADKCPSVQMRAVWVAHEQVAYRGRTMISSCQRPIADASRSRSKR